MADTPWNKSQIKSLAPIVPMISDGQNKLVSDEKLINILTAGADNAPEPTLAQIARMDELAKYRADGLLVRDRKGAIEMILDLEYGLSNLKYVFPRQLDANPNRFLPVDNSTYIQHRCRKMPYCPVYGISTDSGDVMLYFEARSNADHQVPQVVFYNASPESMSIKESDHGNPFSVLIFKTDPMAELTISCPDTSTVEIELRLAEEYLD